jgi:hypothetical protein
MEKDFEYYLTKHVWDNLNFARQLEEDPIQALRSININVPPEVKLQVIVQEPNTIYFTLPPIKKDTEPDHQESPEEMDIWSSGESFVWISPVEAKFNLFRLRNAVPETES